MRRCLCGGECWPGEMLAALDAYENQAFYCGDWHDDEVETYEDATADLDACRDRVLALLEIEQ